MLQCHLKIFSNNDVVPYGDISKRWCSAILRIDHTVVWAHIEACYGIKGDVLPYGDFTKWCSIAIWQYDQTLTRCFDCLPHFSTPLWIYDTCQNKCLDRARGKRLVITSLVPIKFRIPEYNGDSWSLVIRELNFNVSIPTNFGKATHSTYPVISMK